MIADHLLHVSVDDDWFSLSLSCIEGTDGRDEAMRWMHVCLSETTCTCDCEMCTGDDPDHWGCDRQPHEYSLDGLPPCQTDYDPSSCWTKHIDQPLIECTLGIFPEDAAPWPVTVRYLGDGDVEIRYAPPSEVAADDQERG